MRFLVVGAGFSGAVVARCLAEAGHSAVVVDQRDHVAGNCYTERDAETGVLVHRYGPHLFHTARPEVVEYLERFGDWVPHEHRVRATTASGVYSLPINLLTLNQFFGQRLGPQAMRDYVAARTLSLSQPTTFEQQALAMVGDDIYREFFAGYTAKQWGRSPTELPASILKRLPMRFDYNDRYFSDPVEQLPKDGYTAVVEAILDHRLIELQLSTTAGESTRVGFDHVVWTGPIDAFFDFELGRLPYRTLDFEWEVIPGDFQGCSVMNYCEEAVAYTRIAQHNNFEPWRFSPSSVISIERSREAEQQDIPYYPVRLADSNDLLADYIRLAMQAPHVTFVGRLGTYRYLDMDAAIAEALQAGELLVQHAGSDQPMPTFCTDPN